MPLVTGSGLRRESDMVKGRIVEGKTNYSLFPNPPRQGERTGNPIVDEWGVETKINPI